MIGADTFECFLQQKSPLILFFLNFFIYIFIYLFILF